MSARDGLAALLERAELIPPDDIDAYEDWEYDVTVWLDAQGSAVLALIDTAHRYVDLNVGYDTTVQDLAATVSPLVFSAASGSAGNTDRGEGA